jgi:hypothetical protein
MWRICQTTCMCLCQSRFLIGQLARCRCHIRQKPSSSRFQCLLLGGHGWTNSSLAEQETTANGSLIRTLFNPFSFPCSCRNAFLW